jgi:sialate O-acetylesterase
MPFYAVQIAPYNYSDPKATDSPLLQEAQMKASQEIPHAGLATTLDIGNPTCIHPEQKKPVGQRLAALALVNDYGLKGFNPVAPRLESARFENGEAILTFNTGDQMGLSPGFVELKGFEVAGADKVFHPAVGIITGWNNQVVVKCPEVAEPAAVRYGFRNWCEGTLFNNYGIPAGPFRTDDWNL